MGAVRILTDGGVVVLRCDHGGPDGPPSLVLEDPGPTFGLALSTQRCPDPVPGVRVEVLRSGLCGDLCSVGAALVPDGGGEVVWLSAPERSDAGQILAAVEVLRAATPAAQVSAPPVAAPRARVAQVSAWDAVVAPNGLAGGLPDEASRTGEALYALITALAEAVPAQA